MKKNAHACEAVTTFVWVATTASRESSIALELRQILASVTTCRRPRRTTAASISKLEPAGIGSRYCTDRLDETPGAPPPATIANVVTTSTSVPAAPPWSVSWKLFFSQSSAPPGAAAACALTGKFLRCRAGPPTNTIRTRPLSSTPTSSAPATNESHPRLRSHISSSSPARHAAAFAAELRRHRRAQSSAAAAATAAAATASAAAAAPLPPAPGMRTRGGGFNRTGGWEGGGALPSAHPPRPASRRSPRPGLQRPPARPAAGAARRFLRPTAFGRRRQPPSRHGGSSFLLRWWCRCRCLA